MRSKQYRIKYNFAVTTGPHRLDAIWRFLKGEATRKLINLYSFSYKYTHQTGFGETSLSDMGKFASRAIFSSYLNIRTVYTS